MTTPIPFDPTTLGTDLNVSMADVAGVWGIASGILNYGNVVIRRLSNAEGLFYDPAFKCYDVLGLLNADLGAAEIAAAQASISAAIEDDERCDTCAARLRLDPQTEDMQIALDIRLITGQVFQLILGAAGVNLAVLAVNGVPVPGTTNAQGQGIQLLQGPAGADSTTPGPAGPAGASGTPQVVLDFDEPAGSDDGSGNEIVVYQRLVNFGALPGTVTLELVAQVASSSGTALFKVRVGGTTRLADGTVRASMSTGSSSPVPLNNQTTFANPGGLQLVKITSQSSGPGEFGYVLDRTLTVR